MRRTICFFLVIMMLISISGVSIAESDTIEFEPDLTLFFASAMDSSYEWGTSGMLRALLSISLLYDVQKEYDDAFNIYAEAVASADVYIGRMGRGEMSGYVVTYRTSDRVLSIAYFPIKGTAQYSETGWVSKSTITKAGELFDGFWEIESDDIGEALDGLGKLLEALK